MNRALALPVSIHEPGKLKTWQLFSVLAVFNLITLYILNSFILTNEVYYTLLSSRMEISRIDDYLSLVGKMRLWGYLIAPVILWLRIMLVALLIQLPLMIKFIEIPFKQLFRIVAWANTAMIISAVVQIIYMSGIPASQFTQNTLSFIPVSLINLFNGFHFSAAAAGLVRSINIFELAWVFIIYKGLQRTKRLERIDSAIIALGVWVGIEIFQFALLTYLNRVG